MGEWRHISLSLSGFIFIIWEALNAQGRCFTAIKFFKFYLTLIKHLMLKLPDEMRYFANRA